VASSRRLPVVAEEGEQERTEDHGLDDGNKRPSDPIGRDAVCVDVANQGIPGKLRIDMTYHRTITLAVAVTLVLPLAPGEET
jgi:hypothetical protein